MSPKGKEIVLQADPREATSRGTLQNLRRQGRVPAVAYGAREKPLALSVDEKNLQSAIHSERGRNALISLQIGGQSHPVLVKEIQRHPITRMILHVDFHRVSLKEKIEASVPIHVKGEAPGVKLGGGVLEHIIRDIRVRCLPTEIPPSVDVDVSTLQIGQSVKAKELKLPAGVEPLIDGENVVINIVSPTILEETPAPGAAVPTGTAEPEVIKKGKVEEGEEGAPAGQAGAAAAGDKKASAAGAAPAAKAEAKKPEAKKPEGK